MDYFAISSAGFNPSPIPIRLQRTSLAASWGYLDITPDVDVDIFNNGDLLIRQPWSEDYSVNGTSKLLRLPWSENYEAQSGEILNRLPWTEDYLQDSLTIYTRIGNTEDYESPNFKFTRQPFSENYLIEAK